MLNRTKSEHLFERLCEELGVRFCRIPEGLCRTPDYRIELCSTKVLVEVKQIDAPKGNKAPRINKIGAHVAKKISKADQQLKGSRVGAQSTILVVYNNVNPLASYTDPTHIMAASHGNYAFEFSGFSGGLVCKRRYLSGGAKFTGRHNTTISVLCAIFVDPRGNPYLIAYHNRFASAPLNSGVLRSLALQQFRFSDHIPNEFPSWERIV